MKIGIVGAAGRMGQMLVSEVAGTQACVLAGGTERVGSPAVGRDAGELAGVGTQGVAVGDNAEALFQASDAVIDFTVPGATLRHAELAAKHRKVHVIGTTGLSSDDEAKLREAARETRIVYAPNMAVGVTLLTALVERVARTLGPDFDIEIVEMHHRHKIDAPSGTALGLGRAAARGRGVDLDAVSAHARHGHTGERRKGDIGFAVLRGGDVIGDHTVVFAGEGERLELTHRAGGRHLYARGAIRAALWVRDKPPGLYTMFDVLGLS